MSRETFGKPLIQHQLIRFKLAEMARQIEALHDFNERIAYQVRHRASENDIGRGYVCVSVRVCLLGRVT